MNIQELLLKYSPFIKQNLLSLSLAALGMIFFAYGLIGLFISNNSSSNDVVFQASSDTSFQNSQKEIKTIFVDVEGAVVKPGLYKVPFDSRIQDALAAAGGLSASADRNYIAKNINLAIKLTDGAKIYIPNISESVNVGGVLSVSDTTSASALVNINTASQSQLEALPGIGPVTAQKIIVSRPYSSVQELLEKKIVGAKVFGQIKDKLSLY